MAVAVVAGSAVALAVVPVVVLALVARWHFTHRLASFRCRVGSPSWPLRRARWRPLRTRAAWVREVLLVRSGPLHLGVTAFAVAMPRPGRIRHLGPGEVRRLGAHPVSLRVRADDGAALEIAVAGPSVEQLVGPFLTVLLPELPAAPRDQDA